MWTVLFGGAEMSGREIDTLSIPAPGLPGPRPGHLRLEDPVPGAVHRTDDPEEVKKA